jgi:hypothetical protein
MTPQVQQLYKDLYDMANSLPNSVKFGIMPTHFVGPRGHFKKGLPMFIGRDANGLNQVRIPLVDDYEYDELKWLKAKEDGYYYNKSPFWRVVGHVLEQIREEPFGDDIYHDFYWSDLYKINFREKKGTTKKLRDFQINKCAQLLLAEMDDLEPCISIFLTGINEDCRSRKGVGRFFERWEPRGQLKSKNESTGEFTLVGDSGKAHRCIVVPHPQGKVQEEIIQKICSLWK